MTGREMVHLAIDGIWQVLKLQRSTSRNDFCRIAAKNGILPRLANTLYSLNEATRLALVSGGGGFPVDGITIRPQSGQLDPGNPTFVQSVAPPCEFDHPDYLKVKHAVVDDILSSGTHDSSQASVSHSSDSRPFPLDSDRPQSNAASLEGPVTTKSHDSSALDKLAPGMKERSDPSRTAHRSSTDRISTLSDGVSNGHSATLSQQDNENMFPLSNERKTNSLDFYMAEFAGVYSSIQYSSLYVILIIACLVLMHLYPWESSVEHVFCLDMVIFLNLTTYITHAYRWHCNCYFIDFTEVTGHGREHANLESAVISPPKIANKNAGPPSSSEGTTSTSGLASQTGSGVPNARPRSATSSGLLLHVTPPWSADVAWEYVKKVADLLLEFAGSDTTVKSYMCSQNLLTRIFLMFSKIEPAILLKVHICSLYNFKYKLR